MTELKDHVVLVVGGTRGIGFATAASVASAGATVVITGRDASEAKRRATELAERWAAPVAGVPLEITDDDAVQATVRAVAKEHGRLDGVVVTAGVLEEALIGMITPDQVRNVLSINVAGTISVVQAAARAMIRRKRGSIVLLGSIVGERGGAGQSVYAASKAGVVAVARSAAKELGRHGIRVNAVTPGVITTELIDGQSEPVIDKVLAGTALGRLGASEEVAHAIRFLLSDDASFITGQVLGVDGGLVL